MIARVAIAGAVAAAPIAAVAVPAFADTPSATQVDWHDHNGPRHHDHDHDHGWPGGPGGWPGGPGPGGWQGGPGPGPWQGGPGGFLPAPPPTGSFG
ncbi:hypothetical protein NONO_c00630 [Nocardia nova SH22a]|uniref:Uncharacterized protein n=1 Tax=Nocardia nova SH22a TaxID=1415166 RepID=W5T7I2_9NOCA|nr:hypothetical protein [Nocardia nova]AHH14883.1 hypothetical protein NONO_c00630 [Nocardia nova SH22a]